MKPEMNRQNWAIVVPTWFLPLLRLNEPKDSVALENKSPGNTSVVRDGQLDSSGSSILEERQAFFVPRLDPDLDDPKSPGLWSIARGESLSLWEIRKVDFTDASPGFRTIGCEIPSSNKTFQDLADRLKIDMTALFQLVHEVRETVVVGNKNPVEKGQST